MTVLVELSDILFCGIRNRQFWLFYICKSILVTEIYISGRFVVRVLVDRILTSYGCILIRFLQNMSGQILYLLDDNSGYIDNSGYRKKITIIKSTFLVTENAKNTRKLTILVEKMTRIVDIRIRNLHYCLKLLYPMIRAIQDLVKF